MCHCSPQVCPTTFWLLFRGDSWTKLLRLCQKLGPIAETFWRVSNSAGLGSRCRCRKMVLLDRPLFSVWPEASKIFSALIQGYSHWFGRRFTHWSPTNFSHDLALFNPTRGNLLARFTWKWRTARNDRTGRHLWWLVLEDSSLPPKQNCNNRTRRGECTIMRMF